MPEREISGFLIVCLVRARSRIAVVQVKAESDQLVLTITDPRGKKLETLRD